MRLLFTVFAKEVVDNIRDRRTLASALLMGPLFGNQFPRIVRINEFSIDVLPQGKVIFIHNEDEPGVVGTVGTILGRNKINIAEMSLGRIRKGKKMLAMTVINTDNAVPEKVVNEIKKFRPILDVKVVNL